MKDYTPAQWVQIAATAKARLLKDRGDARALRAFRAALPHVSAQRESERAQAFLKDLDPGTLASFGLGAADMMSFGLGDQAARLLLGDTARMTQQQAQAQHPTAHLVGEVAGLLGPAAVEAGLAKAGKLAPSAIGTFVRGIQNRAVRAAAKTALNAATGAAYAGAQAAGRTEGGLAARGQAALQAAPYGAAAGVALPVGIAAAKQAVRPVTRYVDRVLSEVAGKAAPVATKAATRAPVSLEPLLPALRQPDPLDLPTFARRAPPAEPTPGLLPWYPRGGRTEQMLNPVPQVSLRPLPAGLPMDQAQLKLLLDLPAAQFEAAAAMFPDEVIQQVRALRGGLLQPARP
jgi:hypothetical protein